MLYDTEPGPILKPETQVALAEINATKEAPSIQQDFRLVPGQMLTGRVLDPAGKPLVGAHCSGFLHNRTPTYWQSETDKFQINAYRPDHPRRLLFVHLERKLAGSLIVEGSQTGPITVRLQPWGEITGRIVNAQGKPMANLQIARWSFKLASDLHEGYLPTMLNKKAADGNYHRARLCFPTDRDGRFHIEGLAPGIKYDPWVWDEKGKLLGELISSVTVESGQTKDLGDLRLKPLDQSAPAKR
jgi:protocatechuate 3,4-dioxygenase beta subunit